MSLYMLLFFVFVQFFFVLFFSIAVDNCQISITLTGAKTILYILTLDACRLSK